MGHAQVAYMSEVARGSRGGWGPGRAHNISVKALATQLIGFLPRKVWSQYGWKFWFIKSQNYKYLILTSKCRQLFKMVLNDEWFKHLGLLTYSLWSMWSLI